jgi:DNA-directed RNA polymerase subunit RPC12/RpoP
MTLTQIRCADCGGKNVEGERTYTIKDGVQRTMYHCASCGCSFSETKQTPLAYMLPENRNCFLKGWKNKGSQEVTASETGKMGG